MSDMQNYNPTVEKEKLNGRAMRLAVTGWLNVYVDNSSKCDWRTTNITLDVNNHRLVLTKRIRLMR
jgi:hypothetical protein